MTELVWHYNIHNTVITLYFKLKVPMEYGHNWRFDLEIQIAPKIALFWVLQSLSYRKPSSLFILWLEGFEFEELSYYKGLKQSMSDFFNLLFSEPKQKKSTKHWLPSAIVCLVFRKSSRLFLQLLIKYSDHKLNT